MLQKINDSYFYLGQDDDRLALFENAYPIPRGVSYNSYLLLDEQKVRPAVDVASKYPDILQFLGACLFV